MLQPTGCSGNVSTMFSHSLLTIKQQQNKNRKVELVHRELAHFCEEFSAATATERVLSTQMVNIFTVFIGKSLPSTEKFRKAKTEPKQMFTVSSTFIKILYGSL